MGPVITAVDAARNEPRLRPFKAGFRPHPSGPQSFYCHGETFVDTTEVEVVIGEEESIYLFLSPEEKRDRGFVDALMSRWKNARPEATEKAKTGE
jgi:hypothetical protein